MRYWFGGSPADYVVSPGQQTQLSDETFGYQALLVPGVVLWVFDTQTGDRVLDLLDATGTATDQITTAEYGAIPRFRGPDETTKLLIGPAPTGSGDGGDSEQQGRWLVTSTDWPNIVSGVQARVAALEDNQGGGGGDHPDLVATAHPLVWSMAGEIQPRTSKHTYVNLEGRSQTVTRLRAAATVLSGQVTVHLLTMDMDTGVSTVVAAVPLTPTTPADITSPDVTVSDGTGLTVQVETVGATTSEDLTVQVMIR